jgi:hypothetical protein
MQGIHAPKTTSYTVIDYIGRDSIVPKEDDMKLTPFLPRKIAGKTLMPTVILAVIAAVFFPVDLAAQGQPVANGPMLPLALWWGGACILGVVIAYAILRNRSRTRAEKQLTEQATKNLYAEEERDRRRSEPG